MYVPARGSRPDALRAHVCGPTARAILAPFLRAVPSRFKPLRVCSCPSLIETSLDLVQARLSPRILEWERIRAWCFRAGLSRRGRIAVRLALGSIEATIDLATRGCHSRRK